MARKRKLTAGIDQSKLPDLVVYQILQTLPPKLAIQARILSRQWDRVWSLLRELDFDYDKFPSTAKAKHCYKRRMFFHFLYSCLKRRKRDKYDIDKFRLSMKQYLRGSEIVDKWLNFVAERNLRELDVNLSTATKDRTVTGKYFIPQPILNVKTLRTLILESVRIREDISSISLPALKTMSLKYMELTNKKASLSLISGCPSIESLSFDSCVLWNDAEISSSSLKSLEVLKCSQYYGFDKRSSNVVVRVEAINLESFRYSAIHRYTDARNMQIFSCQALKNLEFSEARFQGRWLDDEVIKSSRFPHLESLVLHNVKKNFDVLYQGLDGIDVENRHLKRLVFVGGGGDILKAKINTPNLRTFELSVECMPHYVFRDLLSQFSLNAPKLSEATLNFDLNFAGKDFPRLINFLGNFDSYGKLRLSVIDAEALIFPEEMRKTRHSPLPNLKHLKVVINSSMPGTLLSVLKDSLQWLAPTLEGLKICNNKDC